MSSLLSALRWFVVALTGSMIAAAAAPSVEPLFDWSAWSTYRSTVRHPSGAIQAADLARARENIRRYPWAQAYAKGVERSAAAALPRITPAFLEQMIPVTTPGDPKFTPCPACRAAGKPVHPHGLWSWNPNTPEQLTCDVCHTVFPNAAHPETIALTTRWGEPQTLTFYGGDPFVIFGYKTGRPSFTANIRARKVAYAAGLCRTFGEAYLLTGDAAYASATRALLVRFAAVYPHWLVHNGYGEFADMSPRVAAQFINQLPEPELCAPPNQPDRKLHTGYWTAGRASGVGQESHFVRRMLEAYDFTCEARDAAGAPVYSEADRLLVERDLLLESTLLLVADKQINNKSVGNRTAAALVGLCVGHPELVRFGWDGFKATVDGWFLPDGTTSESPAYATMTLGNIWDMAQALRGYSDPAGYRDAAGTRIDGADPYHGTAYERVWRAMFNGLQGDATYPAFADSYRGTSLGSHFTELMVAAYPERPEYLALLKVLTGDDLGRVAAATALYYREPGLEKKPAPTLTLPDWVAPDLRIGHLRSGADGRESLLLVSASHWGGHHHEDSLNLTYWKRGAELFSDLGYLWDHPMKHQTAHTLAHNTVLIDEQDQRTKERRGTVHTFRTSPHVKLIDASSEAYAAATQYRRVSALIDHGDGHSYVVDVFRVQGGARQDYVFHAAAKDATVLDLALQPAEAKSRVYDLAAIRTAPGEGVWRTSWPSNNRMTTLVWSIGQPGERVFVGNGWGQRDWRNTDHGATLPYIVRRTEGAAPHAFTSVIEGYEAPASAFIRAVTREPTGALRIEHGLGTDLVLCSATPAELATTAGAPMLTGRFLVASLQNGQVAWTFAEPGAP